MNIFTRYRNAQSQTDNRYVQAMGSEENCSACLKHLMSQRNFVAFLGFVMTLCSYYVLLRDTRNMQRVTEIPSTFVLCFVALTFIIAIKMDLDNQIKALKHLKDLQKSDG